ncbi:hypothetical protein EJD97_021400 [Solanum chilense]|uniref:Cytochrome P450 n=1 Tax=Solanum chilense TaxID=4083 RepID=A0A6N2AV95_SOLCI|nr:hypothetical protein EJD97_021400 [Solanum chilense]
MINYLFTLILLFLVLIITLKYIYSYRKKLPLPPGPFPWPLIGNLLQIGKRRPHAALAKLSQVHGPDFMSIRFSTRLIVVASSPAAAAEVLKTHDRVLSGRYVSRVVRVKGSIVHNLSTAFLEECDDNWKKVRTIYRGALFSTKALESQVSTRENKVMEMIRYLEEIQLNQVIQIRKVIFVTVLNILGNLLLSMDLIDFEGRGVGEEMMKYLREFTETGKTQELADMFPVLGAICSMNFQKTYKKIVDLFDKTSVVWAGVVQERRKRESQTSVNAVDFVDALVKNGFTDKHINALLMELFGAGTETTIVTKTLRLHPPGPLLLPHRAMETCEVMGYRIPKDTQLMVNMWAIARDPKVWDDPSSFKPERFMNSKMDYKGQYFEYIPFGSGRRMCAGEPLASRFVPLVVASMIHKFDWFLPNDMNPDQIDMDEILDLIISKKDPILLIPKLRK